MADVSLTINGRNYSISCDDGQERRVMELGSFIDKRLREIARGAGAVSEQHLFVLTSLLMADELFDLRERSEELEEIATRPNFAAQSPAANDELSTEREAHMADMIKNLAKKIEAVSSQLAQASA